MHEEIVNQNYIPTAPNSVSIEKTDLILKQLKRSIFEIKYNDIKSTGFLCKIKINEDAINALVLNYKVFNEKISLNNEILKISFDNGKNDKTSLEISVNSNRIKKYFEELNVTIIEIKEEDIKEGGKFNDIEFLELDDNLDKEDSELFYNDESIYVLHYKEENKASVSYGLIAETIGNEIIIYCDINQSSIGAPILNLTNNKIIGICKEITKDSSDRKGVIFKYTKNLIVLGYLDILKRMKNIMK